MKRGVVIYAVIVLAAILVITGLLQSPAPRMGR